MWASSVYKKVFRVRIGILGFKFWGLRFSARIGGLGGLALTLLLNLIPCVFVTID